MAHNQKMLDDHKDDEVWKNGVEIIGISIDNAREAVKNHVASKGWESVIHYHRDKSNCSVVYGVKGVPHVMLIDKEGTIVFKGHPATRKNLEEDLTKLAKGEKLEGDGIAEKAAADDGAAVPEFKPEPGFKEMKTDELKAQIEIFKKKCSEW